MYVFKPVKVDDARLTYSSIPENEHPVYSAATTYTAGDHVVCEHKVYKSITGGQGHYPPETSDDTTGNWVLIGPTNQWAMFNGFIDKVTTSTGSAIEVHIVPGVVVDKLSLFGVYGSQVTVEVDDPVDGVVLQETISLHDNSWIKNIYDYLFSPLVQSSEKVVTIPPYSNATIKVRIEGDSVGIGLLALGKSQFIGTMQYSSSFGYEDYSTKEVDEFGNPEIVERRYINVLDYLVTMDESEKYRVKGILASLRATPSVWVGLETDPSSIIYGIPDDLEVVYTEYDISDYNLRVTGV